MQNEPRKSRRSSLLTAAILVAAVAAVIVMQQAESVLFAQESRAERKPPVHHCFARMTAAQRSAFDSLSPSYQQQLLTQECMVQRRVLELLIRYPADLRDGVFARMVRLATSPP